MLRISSPAGRIFFAMWLLTAATGSASASFVVNFDSVTTDGAEARFNYSLELDQTPITPNGKSAFTIVDFAGFTGATEQPDDWVFKATRVGGLNGATEAVDSPELWNLTWIYVGKSAINRNKVSNVGTFSAWSSISELTDGLYLANGTQSTTGSVRVPKGAKGSDSPTGALSGGPLGAVIPNPEPSSLVLLGLGTTFLAGRAVRKRRSTK